jgi:SAM-dependent methyltransferase
MNASALPFSPASERNKGPILEVLRGLLPPQASVLEIASGTGQHAEHFATQCPGWVWQPSDVQAQALPAVAARCAALPQVLPPVLLDVLMPAWPVAAQAFDAVYCANLLHISPWVCCAALMQGAARHLAPGGALVLYGPYRVDGEPLAEGNRAFDADLRERNPQWGLRLLADVAQAAQAAGLAFEGRFSLPANNLALVFRQAA